MNRYRWNLALLLALTVAALCPLWSPASGQDKDLDAPPPALREYMGRRIAQTMHWLGADWLTRTEREREEGVSLLETDLAKRLKPGMTACDLGCGNGFWTLELSKMVGEEGKVFAVDIQKEMLAMLEKRAGEAGAKNITPILNTLTTTGLEPESCDLILLVDVYHEFSHPVHMLASMRQALKPGGLIALVEYRAEDPEVPIKPEHKMTAEQANKEYAANGFKLVESYEKLPWQHVLYFQRDDGAKPGGAAN